MTMTTTTTLLPRAEIAAIIGDESVRTLAEIAWDAAGPHHDGVATIDLTDGVIWGTPRLMMWGLADIR